MTRVPTATAWSASGGTTVTEPVGEDLSVAVRLRALHQRVKQIA